MFSAFRVPSFRYQFGADSLTSWAVEMEILVLGWYVLTETDSPFLLALIGAARYAGSVLTPFLGTLADRLPRKHMLIAVRGVFALLALGLAGLAFTGQLVPWHAFAAATINGLARPADTMLRQSLIADTVPPGALINAIGFARTTVDGARIAGALAGASLMAALGIGAAYVAIALCYAASTALSFGITNTPTRSTSPTGVGVQFRGAGRQALDDLRKGLAYVTNSPLIRALLWTAFLVNLSGLCITGGLLPLVARDVYGMNELGLGALVATFSGGALIGSLLTATVMTRLKPDRIMLWSIVGWHVVLLAFASIPSPGIGIPLLGIIGLLSSFVMVPLASTLMANTNGAYRGRVMGLRQLAVVGIPLGLLIAGALIELVDIRIALSSLALVGLIFGILMLGGWRKLAYRS